MAVDPYEDDVLENFSDLPMGTEATNVFIDQVEPSQAWTTWRDNLANEIMDVNSGLPAVSKGMKKSIPTSRRVWTYGEEKELVNALRDLDVKGLKCDNGFKSGYLNLLENILAVKFPGTDLKGDPHINSKIHVWKKQYACLKFMLGVSGIGLNSTTYHIDALPEVWAAHIKTDPTARGMKNKSFPFYADWFGQITDTMGNIAQRVGSEFDACKRRGHVYEQFGLIGYLTVESRVEIAQYLCNNPKDMDLFFSLPDDAKNVLVNRIMRKLGDAE
ncbi:hypothetical protein ACS0TY_035297 [Phlomoides rotata]